MIKIKIYKIKEVYKILDKLKLKLAPDKTYIGNMTGGKGFVFLGNHIEHICTANSNTNFANMAVNVSRLYEQHASHDRMEKYLKNWQRWAKAKVGLLYDPIIFRGLSCEDLKKLKCGRRKINCNNKLELKFKHKNSTPTSYPNLIVCNGRLVFG